MKFLRKLLVPTILLGALFLTVTPAPATILFAGGEDVDWTCVTNCQASTNAGNYRSAYARLGYGVAGNTADPIVGRLQSPTFTASSTIWFHAQFCHTGFGVTCNATNGTVSNSQMIRFMDTAGNPTLIIRGTGTARQVKVSSRTSAGVFTDLVTCSNFFDNAVGQIDVFINYGAAGTITLYSNSSQVCTFTGDNRNGDGATQINGVELGNPCGGCGNSVSMWSEVIVADSDTRAKALLRLTPNGAGNTVAWSGTNPCTAILNNASFNDASYAQSATNDQLLQCTVTNTFPAGTWRIDAVVMAARIMRGSTGPQNFAFSTRTGAADFASGDIAPTTSFSNIGNNIQATNPNTAAAWVQSDITAAGFNIGLKARP